jgi:hypothetical protein
VWQQVDRRLAVCYAKGNPWKQDMPRLRQQLQQMITIAGAPLQMFVVADRDYHPDLPHLRQRVQANNLQWHVWERAEIENYLLSVDGIRRVLGEPNPQLILDEAALRNEFDQLLNSSRDAANDRLAKAFQEYGKGLGENWDASTLSRRAREYLQQHWEAEKLSLADAKDVVLPGIKRWLQAQQFGQFSDKALAEVLTPADIPSEVHGVARELASFTGIVLEP